MQRVTLEEAQKRLPELVRSLPMQGDLLILDADVPVARLIGAQAAGPQDYATLAARLKGAGLKYKSSTADPIGELVAEREQEDAERTGSL